MASTSDGTSSVGTAAEGSTCPAWADGQHVYVVGYCQKAITMKAFYFRLPYPDGAFVAAGDEHLYDRKRCACGAEVRRVSRDGGPGIPVRSGLHEGQRVR
jgi:hypothetical protein